MDPINIPDTVYGAVLVSLIDFILSFVIITGIGAVLAVLPVVNKYWEMDEAKLKSGH